jgi:hypothetical protein
LSRKYAADRQTMDEFVAFPRFATWAIGYGQGWLPTTIQR